MPKFDYIRPTSLNEALELVNDSAYASRLLAGGTDFMVHLHHHELGFDRVIDISLLPELKIVSRQGETICLGSGVTFAEAIENELLQQAVPFLVEACRQVGGPQIRNMGTLGGNVVNAAACADSLPVLVCLDAVAHLRSVGKERQVPLAEFIVKPNQTRLEQAEILTHFSFQAPPAGTKTTFIKLGRRNAQAISRLTMAVMGRVDAAGLIDFLHLAPGAATPQIIRFRQVEEQLLGQPPTEERLTAAGRQVAETMIGITGRRWSTKYKEPVIAVLAERALRRIFLS